MATATRQPMRAVRISDELWQAAQAKAAERGESLSLVIRRALEHYAGACPCCGRLPTG
jgi:predicted HicB family RNase H-like nuclease